MLRIFHNQKAAKLTTLEWIMFFLANVGGINWALIGVFNVDLIQFIFSDIGNSARIVQVLIGVASIYIAWLIPQTVKR